MSALKAVLVDDDPDDLRHAKRLTSAGLECDAIDARVESDDLRETLRTALDEKRYQIVLLDYRLDLVPSDRLIAGPRSRGGTIAAEIRELYPHVPIALVTTEEKLHKWVLDKPKVHELFDIHVLKSKLATRSGLQQAASDLKALAQGYLVLSELPESDDDSDQWSFLKERLRASDEEVSQLQRLYGSRAPSDVAEAASWLLSLLEFKGPFLDANEVRTRLGITRTGFSRDEVQQWLAPARYLGPFASLRQRWWRSRVEDMLTEASQDEWDRSKAVAGAARTTTLQAATCVWCGGHEVRRACHICSEGVDTLHSISIFNVVRPGWAEPEVVCFVCIRDGRAEDVLFEPGSESIVSRLKQGKIEQKSASGGGSGY